MGNWIGENFVSYEFEPGTGGTWDKFYIYLPESGKEYNIGSICKITNNDKEYNLSSIVGKVYGNKFIAQYNVSGESSYPRYALASFGENNKAEIISDFYTSMSSDDNGKTFLVEKATVTVKVNGYITSTNKNVEGIGYIDANGKELGLFDNAGSFVNDSKYAPVINEGKFYLIDKNMKAVSDTIDVEKEFAIEDEGAFVIIPEKAIKTLDNDLYLYEQGTSKFLILRRFFFRIPRKGKAQRHRP